MPINSPNMNLPVPIVGTDTGPTWATLIDQCLAIIDAHTHAPGSGVPITPSAINISSDLSFNGNNATSLRTARMSAQSSSIPSTSPDISCLYSVSGELYWNDSAGNIVPITNNGNVNAGAGSITNLPFSGAAAFNSSTGAYVWQATSTPTPAFMDNAGIILRYNSSTPSPSGNYVFLTPSSALSSQITLTIPSTYPGYNHGFWSTATNGTTSYVYPDSVSGAGSTLDINGFSLEVAAGGINTTQLANNAVIAAKIANNTITGTQIAPSINLPGNTVQENGKNIVVSNTNASSSLCIVRGYCDGVHNPGSGTSYGEGWTVSVVSPGEFTITFTTPFASAPAFTASAAPSNSLGSNTGSNVTNISTSSAGVTTLAGGSPFTYPFSFIAIGPR